MSYESSDDEVSPSRTNSAKSNKVPSLNETDFPETFGSGGLQPQSGISFAALNFDGQDQSAVSQDAAQPARRVVTRISRLREMYYKSRDVARAPLGKTWSLFVDGGLQGPEKNAECQSKLLGQAETTRAFEPLIAPLRQPLGSGSNVRLFKSIFSSPSALDEGLEKGGKWAVAVSKDISRDMFEELCLYVMDERLGYLADGCVFAVRDGADVLQVWTRSAPKPEDVNKLSQDLCTIMGLDTNVNVAFERHANAFKKASQAKKYFCIETPPLGIPVASQEQALQPRSKNNAAAERKEKKDKKKKGRKTGDEGFTEVEVKAKKSGSNQSQKDTEEESVATTSSNPFGNLAVEQDEKKKGSKEEPEAPIVFHKRKKPASKKGSSKGKRNVKDEFADLPVVEGSVVPLPVFMGSVFAILVLMLLLWSWTSNANA